MSTIKSKEEVFEKVKQIFSDKSGTEWTEIKPESDLYDDLGLDSLDKIEIVMECEKEFHISIYDEETEKISTVGQLSDLISSKPSLAY